MPAQTLGYSGVLFEDRRRFYPSPQMVAQLYSPVTPFLSSIMAREAMADGPRQVDDKDYKLFEHRQHWRYQQAEVDSVNSNWTGGGSSGAPGETATVNLKNLQGVKENDSLVGMTVDIWDANESTNRGRALITAYNANNDRITLKAIGNPAAGNEQLTDLAADDVFYFVSSAHGEGDTAPEAYSDTLDVVKNSVQRTRTAVEITEDLRRAVLRGNRSELARIRNEKQNEHKVKISRQFLYGHRVGGIGGTAHRAGNTNDDTTISDQHITDANGNRVTTTMGWITAMQRYGEDDDAAIKHNWFDRDATTYDFTSMTADSEKWAQYADRDVLTAYCGGPVISFFSTRALSNNNNWDITISDRQTSRLGFSYRILETPHVAIRLVKEPTLRGTPHQSKMMMPDLDHVGTAQYAPDTYETNIKTDDNPDLQKDEITSWKGLSLRLMERHFVVDFDNLIEVNRQL